MEHRRRMVMERIELTPEIRKQLMGSLPFSNSARHRFVPEIFKDIPEKYTPVFYLRPFTKSQSERIQIMMKKNDFNEKEIDNLLRYAVVGWENLFDIGDESYVEFESDTDGGVKKAIWDRVPETIKREFVNELMIISGLVRAEQLGLKS